MEAKSYITISPEILESLDKIMHSGSKGIHLLFSNRMIREAFTRDHQHKLDSSQEVVAQVQDALGQLFNIQDLEERREYIASLEESTRDILVHLYFGFLDRYFLSSNNPEPSEEVLH